jgi:zinc transporter ZupT
MQEEHHNECKGCTDRDRCHEVYARLSKSKAEPVALKAFTAFFVPLLSFIVAYMFFFKWLKGCLSGEYVELAAVLPAILSAAAATVLFRYLVSLITKIKF